MRRVIGCDRDLDLISLCGVELGINACDLVAASREDAALEDAALEDAAALDL